MGEVSGVWAKRADNHRDKEFHAVVALDPMVVLDAADFLARQAPLYGIRERVELRRSVSGAFYDRHHVVCRAVGLERRRPTWVLQLAIGRAVDGNTRVDLALQLFRRTPFGIEAGKAAAQYRDLLQEALQLAGSERRPRSDNVIPLRPYLRLAPSA